MKTHTKWFILPFAIVAVGGAIAIFATSAEIYALSMLGYGLMALSIPFTFYSARKTSAARDSKVCNICGNNAGGWTRGKTEMIGRMDYTLCGECSRTVDYIIRNSDLWYEAPNRYDEDGSILKEMVNDARAWWRFNSPFR